MKSSELLRILQRDGWYKTRQSGSHILLEHTEKPGKIPFPSHGSKEIKKGMMQQILKAAGIQITKR